MLLITREQAKSLDEYIVKTIGIPIEILIEHAGMAIAKQADICLRQMNADGGVDVFAGKGMNGQDAFCAARILFSMGYDVRIWEVFNNETLKIEHIIEKFKSAKSESQESETSQSELIESKSSKFELSKVDSVNGESIKSKNIDNKINWQRESCKKIGIPVLPAKEYEIRKAQTQDKKSSLIIDGIFGTSFSLKREMSNDITDIFKKINTNHNHGDYVMSIDLPSGIDSDNGLTLPDTINADVTVTFMFSKVGMMSYPARQYAGKIIIEDIGISKKVLESFKDNTNNTNNKKNNDNNFKNKNKGFNEIENNITNSDENNKEKYETLDMEFAKKEISHRPIDGHKGTFGRTGLVGGNDGMAGSICLSALAAMRCGVGLLYMRVPKSILPQCLTVVPEALISSDEKALSPEMNSMLFGPGMDNNQKTQELMWDAIKIVPKLILDAQALNIIATDLNRFQENISIRNSNKLPWIVLTPHPGEFKRICPDIDVNSRLAAAFEAARRLNSIVVLKGAGTLISSPDGKVAINTTGNSGMAKGGSGDVLSGMIASFMAQGKSPLTACKLAVYLHGICGDLASEELGEHSMLPRDLIEKIPKSFLLAKE